MECGLARLTGHRKEQPRGSYWAPGKVFQTAQNLAIRRDSQSELWMAQLKGERLGWQTASVKGLWSVLLTEQRWATPKDLRWESLWDLCWD